MMRIFLAKLNKRIGEYLQQGEYDLFRRKYEIAQSFKFNGSGIKFYGKGVLKIFNNSYIGSYSTIQVAPGTKVIIGQGCRISHGVRIYTSSTSPDTDFSKKELLLYKKGDVIIGDYCWIGANVFINPGTTVGENSVVGSNSVVTKNIPPFTIYGGVPAKLIRKKMGSELLNPDD
tara:strand:- start:2399 stop:2920 length:522 start_codon:yes stop_codon:yes gene_type:complete